MPQRTTSLLLEAQLNPMATLAVAAGIGALAIGAVAARRAGGGRPGRVPGRGRAAPVLDALRGPAQAVAREVGRQVHQAGRRAGLN